MYKVAICDDDKNYISELTQIILECNAKKNEIQILEFHSGEQLLKGLLDDIDVIFLDIQMAGMNGNETAVRLKERGYHGILVQCSGIFMPTPDTVKIAPFRYLLKQDSREKTLKEMEEILAQMIKKRQCYEMDAYYLRKKVVIHVSDIVYITHHPKRKSVLHLCHERAGEFDKGNVIVPYDFEQLSEILKDADFAIPHNSYMVNLSYVSGFDWDKNVLIVDGETLTVSRAQRNDFRWKFTKYVGGKY